MTVAYDALLASTAPAFVVLVEVQPMEKLGVWTKEGAFTIVYSCSFASQIATTIVAGGLYRRLDSVRQDATALTLRASAALVEANPGSYCLDTTANKLYVSTTTGGTPENFSLLGAWFTVLFSSGSISFSDQPLYLPLITGTLPQIAASMPDALFGADESTTGTVSLLNGDGLFDRLSKQYVWRNKKAIFKLGGQGLAYSDFTTVAAMRINGLQVDDEVATLELEDFGSILNKTLPFKTWGDNTFSAATPTIQGAKGAYQPLIFGAIAAAPLTLLSDFATTGLGDYYGAFDIDDQQTITIGNVIAISRTTGAGTVLTNGSDYFTTGGNVIIVTNATYFNATYGIVADLTNVGGTVTSHFGSCARAILSDCGEDPANIDAAAFTAADTAAPQLLYRFLNHPMLAADLMRELEQSVNGQVYRGPDGRWTCRLMTQSIPSAYVSLSDADFVSWQETAGRELPVTVLGTIRVRYSNIPSTGDWSAISASSNAVSYANETTDSVSIDTWLSASFDAAALADHLRFLRTAVPSRIAFEERGLTLMGSSVGDLVAITRSRAPNARTGAYAGHFLRIVRLTKALGPDTPIVSGLLDDLDGQTDHIARCFDSGAAVTWSAATEAQRAVYGFCGDANRYVDPTDPLTKDLKVVV